MGRLQGPHRSGRQARSRLLRQDPVALGGAREDLAEAEARAHRSRVAYEQAIRRLQASGASLREIGDASASATSGSISSSIRRPGKGALRRLGPKAAERCNFWAAASKPPQDRVAGHAVVIWACWPKGCATTTSPGGCSSVCGPCRRTCGTCWPSSGCTPSWKRSPSRCAWHGRRVTHRRGRATLPRSLGLPTPDPRSAARRGQSGAARVG
jgi:hypothetical protein